ncbi:MAG: bifunctional 5,10-methylenetetrahydrofolate dehydrogenase/5,10-methenyltetrahydrofolate cyclohydrolase, partial [Chloroflexota bacterium]|nr:bifunctional 5,10-methylenetetrahydrofolate dehydrogenase/5,10-methenyltetrahydrofolate cyclohydrolase [Chloroflexota bacterium]
CAMGFQMHVLPDDTTAEHLIAHLNGLAAADDVHGIMLQRPLPPALDVRAVMAAFPAGKDIEGVTPINLGGLAIDTADYLPASTPSAAIEILKYYQVPIEGKRAVVVGRSDILGKPMALLLLHANATVIACHSKTRDLADLTRQAELLVAAAGKPKLITGDMVARGAVVIDFGVNVVGDQLIGDVDFDAVKAVASAITPVPGGTGPVTTMMLMRNTLRAAQKQAQPMEPKGRRKWFPILTSPNRRK